MAKFSSGSSGNPNGRPKGALNKRTQVRKAIEKVYEGGEEGFWIAVATQAKEGDSTSQSMLAARLTPPYRASTQCIEFDMPDGDLYVRAKAVLNAIANGDIPPDIGSGLIQSINSTARTMEIISLDERLTLLEGSLK